MFYFDPDLGRMHDSQRAPSAGGSRRRRWEMKSKEAFETSLAMEIQSPQRRTQGRKKDFKKDPSTESQKEKSNLDNSCKEHQVPSPKAQKSNMGKDDNDSDLLSSKLSALIDEANVKAKDLHKRSEKDKDRQQQREKSESKIDIQKEHNVRDIYEMGPVKRNMKDDIISDHLEKQPQNDNEKAQILNDKFETKSLKLADSPKLKNGIEVSDYMASAPPYSPEYRETPKKKHKKKSESSLLLVSNKNEESYITLQLKEMDEDIIDMSKEDKECVLSAPNLLFASASNPHGNISTVYQEKLNGFVLIKNELSGVQKKSEDLHDVTEIPTRSSHAIFIQGGFRTFSVLCQGLLAGLTLAHCLLIFLLDSNSGKIPGLYPSSMAHVFFALILFLTTVCLVAACDS
ncbi:uncharacterized protein [Panulirus ornatus]|uniref:uncharacterized protein isoform X2 n=1 Tax=Panulirus ornatus TaxID=150431 RepID=UPI003A8A66C9